MKTFHRMLALCRKEMRQLLKNPKSRVVLFGPPIMQIFIFGYAATMDLHRIDFAVLDHAHSAASRQLTAKFTGNRIFRAQAPLRSERDLAERIDNRDIRMALIIPPRFDRELAANAAPAVQVIVDGRNSSSAGIALGYAQAVVEQFNRDRSDRPLPVRVESRAWYNPNYNVRYFTVPALLAVLALLDVMLLTALAIAKEREDGTFDQLMLTPYSTGELLAGKAFASIFVGLCQLTCGTLVARLWFQIPLMGSYVTLYTLFLTFLCASVGSGLLISVVSKNLQQAMMGCLIVAIPFAMLSGLTTPVESMPVFFQNATRINPLRYGIKAVQRIFLEGATLPELFPTFAILLAIGGVTFTLAFLIFRRQRQC